MTSFIRNVSSSPGSGLSTVCSTGIPSLDFLLGESCSQTFITLIADFSVSYTGGGIPTGSVVLIEEDSHDIYSRIMLRCFLSQGLYDGHRCLVMSNSKDLNIESLPAKTSLSSQDMLPEQQEPFQGNKIAWRYASKQVDNSLLQGQTKDKFDLSTNITEEVLKQKGLTNKMEKISLTDLTYDLQKKAKSLTKGVDRIVLETLNDPAYGLSEVDLLRLVFQLKSLSRNQSNCAIIISVNTSFSSNNTRFRLHSVVDGVFGLESFDSGGTQMYPDFEGLFLLHKIPRINSLNISRKIETMDLGFQLKKNKRFFEVDKLFLPPEDEEAPTRSTAPSCSASTTKSKIDF